MSPLAPGFANVTQYREHWLNIVSSCWLLLGGSIYLATDKCIAKSGLHLIWRILWTYSHFIDFFFLLLTLIIMYFCIYNEVFQYLEPLKIKSVIQKYFIPIPLCISDSILNYTNSLKNCLRQRIWIKLGPHRTSLSSQLLGRLRQKIQKLNDLPLLQRVLGLEAARQLSKISLKIEC